MVAIVRSKMMPCALSGFGWPVRQKSTASYPSRAAAVYLAAISRPIG